MNEQNFTWITLVFMCSRVAVALSPTTAPAGEQLPSSVPSGDRSATTYHVARLHEPVKLDADWDNPAWRSVPAVELTHYMGKRPEHFPRTQARIVYDNEAVYVIFKVDDRYVKAVAPPYQGSVYKDSCVEFFFTPGTDVAAGYFNIEMNCGGSLYFCYQLIPWKNIIEIKHEDLEQLQIAHTLPAHIDPEITEPTTWTLAYRVPTRLLTTYLKTAEMPAPGVTWRFNLYKCGDGTSHPHSLTWAPVPGQSPNFHKPKSFGTMIFD